MKDLGQAYAALTSAVSGGSQLNLAWFENEEHERTCGGEESLL
jgi:hypothetical protein